MPSDEIVINKLIRIDDWHEAQEQDGELPLLECADEWEFCQLLDARAMVEDDNHTMLPGLVFYQHETGRSMACNFSAKSALAIGQSLITFAGFLLPEADQVEVESIKEGATQCLYENARDQIERDVREELGITSELIKLGATQLGLNDGVKQSRDLIAGLVKALELEPGEERDAVLDEIAPALSAVFADDAG